MEIQVFRNENSSQTNAYSHDSNCSYSGLIPNERALRLQEKKTNNRLVNLPVSRVCDIMDETFRLTMIFPACNSTIMGHSGKYTYMKLYNEGGNL